MEIEKINPNYEYDLKFSIAMLAKAYNKEAKVCQLCLSEKTKILYRDKSKTMNRRSELHGKCFHYEKHRLDRLDYGTKILAYQTSHSKLFGGKYGDQTEFDITHF